MKTNTLTQYLKKIQVLMQQQPKYLDHYHIGLMIIIIVMLLGFFLKSLSKPVDLHQQREIQHFTQQQLYPDTKERAEALLNQQHINQAEYYRLLRLKHLEQGRIRYQQNEDTQ